MFEDDLQGLNLVVELMLYSSIDVSSSQAHGISSATQYLSDNDNM